MDVTPATTNDDWYKFTLTACDQQATVVVLRSDIDTVSLIAIALNSYDAKPKPACCWVS